MSRVEVEVDEAIAFAEAQVPDLLSPRRAEALARLAQRHDALHAALRRLIDHDAVEQAARMVRALRSYWEERHLIAEAQQWTAQALAMPAAAARTPARALLLDHAAALAHDAGDSPLALKRIQECLAIRREVGATPLLPVTLAHLALFTRAAGGDLAQCRAWLEEAIALARAQGNSSIQRSSLYRLAQVAIDQGDWQGARTALAENLRIARATDDAWALGLVLGVCGALAAQEGDAVRALRLAGAGAANRPGISFGGSEQAWLDDRLAPAREVLDTAAQAAAWADGQAMLLPHALTYALSALS